MTRYRRWPSYQAWRESRSDEEVWLRKMLSERRSPFAEQVIEDSGVRAITARQFFYGVLPIRREGEWRPEWLP